MNYKYEIPEELTNIQYMAIRSKYYAKLRHELWTEIHRLAKEQDKK